MLLVQPVTVVDFCQLTLSVGPSLAIKVRSRKLVTGKSRCPRLKKNDNVQLSHEFHSNVQPAMNFTETKTPEMS